MSRTRASAKKAGTSFERMVADYLDAYRAAIAETAAD